MWAIWIVLCDCCNCIPWLSLSLRVVELQQMGKHVAVWHQSGVVWNVIVLLWAAASCIEFEMCFCPLSILSVLNHRRGFVVFGSVFNVLNIISRFRQYFTGLGEWLGPFVLFYWKTLARLPRNSVVILNNLITCCHFACRNISKENSVWFRGCLNWPSLKI